MSCWPLSKKGVLQILKIQNIFLNLCLVVQDFKDLNGSPAPISDHDPLVHGVPHPNSCRGGARVVDLLRSYPMPQGQPASLPTLGHLHRDPGKFADSHLLLHQVLWLLPPQWGVQGKGQTSVVLIHLLSEMLHFLKREDFQPVR